MRTTVGILFLTVVCVLNSTASKILDTMDPKVVPCDDFYNFACGNFLKNTPVPKDKTFVDRFDLLNEKVQQQLQTVLEENIQSNDPRFSKLTKNYYKACMNTAAIEKNGLEPILDDLKILGGWPVLNQNTCKKERFDWKNTTYVLQKLGYPTNFLFTFGVSRVMDKHSSRLFLDQPSFILNPKYLVEDFSDQMMKDYYSYMVDIAVILGANRLTAEKEMKESIKFEVKLANIFVTYGTAEDMNPAKPMTLKEISRKFPSIPWKEYFITILTPFIKIEDDEVIMVIMPSFFKQFEKLINETPKEILANYLLGRTVSEATTYLPEKLRNRQVKFLTAIGRIDGMQPRRSECLDEMSSSLDISLSALYVRKYFKAASKKIVVDLVSNMKKQFIKILKETDWMDEKTKKSALDKINTITEYIGYPDELRDDKIVDEMYNDLEITSENFLRTSLIMSHSKTNYEFRHLRETLQKSNWLYLGVTYPHDSIYSLYDNSIKLMASLLQDIFFNMNSPQYMNYAGIGWLVGRQITRSFDAVGSQYDKDGLSVAWWQPETKKKYAEKTKCIVQQYENYKVNGDDTKNANIADNEGIKAAYLAYQDWVKQHGPEPKLCGINYSQLQMFWITAAQSLCTKYTQKGWPGTIPQNPAELRIRGAFSNRPEFAKDFNCPVGSNMNPAKKCPVW